MTGSGDQNETDSSQEKTVNCPICGEEKLSRGIYLHVNRSVGSGHGEQGEIPDGVDLDNLDAAGEQEVSMDYPETRETEQVQRMCPYCERPFQGKHGVMIHLGQTAGRKNHPENPREEHDPDDFPVVHVDGKGNIVEKVEEPTILPSTERRRERERQVSLEEKIQDLVTEFRQEGKDEAADRLEEVLEDT